MKRKNNFKKFSIAKKFILVFVIVCLMIQTIFAAKDEYIGGGFILYDGVAYAKGNDNSKRSKNFFDTINKFVDVYKTSQISFIPVIQSQIYLEDIPNLNNKLANQKETIEKFDDLAGDDINVINSYNELKKHLDEYIYFKYDNHWTNRGAYYTYKTYCEQLGLEYPELDELEEILINEKYAGDAYGYTNDNRLKNKYDQIYAYLSDKEHTMSVFNNKGTVISTTKVINPKIKNNNTFIAGDNPLTIISVEDESLDKNCLVIKDSFGCAFVPYLINNYKNIIVVDPRFAEFNIVDKTKDYEINDIIFITSIYQPGADSFVNNIKKLIK